MPAPRVSILLPVRNAADRLGPCLDSIAAQTLRDYELLCIDDHSCDGTRALLVARSRRDPRLRILDSPGRGIVAALNHGLVHARGAFIARMDADDRMHRERLARQWAFLRAHPELELVGSRVRILPAGASTTGLREYQRWINACLTPGEIADERYRECPLPHPTWFARKAFFSRYGTYREGPFPEDYELLLRALHLGARIGKHPQVLLEWVDHADRTSRTDPRCERARFDRLRQSYLACDPRLHTGRPLAFWGAGRKTRRRMHWLLALGIRPSYWVDIDPRKIGRRLNGIPVESPERLRTGRRPFVLVLVSSHGARERIADWLEGAGFRRGRDFLQVG